MLGSLSSCQSRTAPLLPGRTGKTSESLSWLPRRALQYRYRARCDTARARRRWVAVKAGQGQTGGTGAGVLPAHPGAAVLRSRAGWQERALAPSTVLSGGEKPNIFFLSF